MTGYMKDVILLHDDARPHASLRNMTQPQKWDGMFFPILLTTHACHTPTATCLAL
jgi:hypothetical protein